MIDSPARTRLAEAIRALAAGLITNDQFESRVPVNPHDPALREVFFSGPWQLYSDLRTHKLIGPYRLPDLARPEIARWILFLKTDRPYQWPVESALEQMFRVALAFLTFGLATRLWRRSVARVGDLSVWPFLTRPEFQAALAQHPYLRGAA